MSEQVRCWVTNAYPGLKVGTMVLALDLPEHGPSGQTQVRVRDERGREHTVQRASLVPLLPEEIAQQQAQPTERTDR